MKLKALKALALTAAVTGGVAHAQTTVGPSNIEVSFYNNGNNFVVQNPGSPPPATPEVQVSGFNILNVAGYGEVYDFCSQFFVGRNDTLTYTVTPGLSQLTTTQQNNVTALLSNAIPAFNAMLDAYIAVVGKGNWNGDPAQRAHLDAYGAGIQMALWELVNETNGVIQLDASQPNKGIFSVDLTAPASASVLEGENDGLTFVNNVKNGVWTAKPNVVQLYYADSPDQQDRIWAQVVPEPSSALLGFLGLGFLLRRRRA